MSVRWLEEPWKHPIVLTRQTWSDRFAILTVNLAFHLVLLLEEVLEEGFGGIMGFRLDFDETNELLRLSFAGSLSDEDIFKAYSILRAAKADCVPRSCIIDYTAVTTVQLSTDTIRRVASMTPTGPTHVVQVSVTPSDLLFGMGRMFQILSDETRPNLHIFRTIDDAYRLLGVHLANFLPLACD